MDFAEVVSFFRALQIERVRYVVIGGIALNLQGIVRATEDIDIFVACDEANIGALRRALFSVFADPKVEEITAGDLAGEYPAIQYAPPGGHLHIDILARLGDAFSFEDIEAEVVIVEGVEVRVATVKMLYRMKVDTVRAQDRADAERLRAFFPDKVGDGKS